MTAIAAPDAVLLVQAHDAGVTETELSVWSSYRTVRLALGTAGSRRQAADIVGRETDLTRYGVLGCVEHVTGLLAAAGLAHSYRYVVAFGHGRLRPETVIVGSSRDCELADHRSYPNLTEASLAARSGVACSG